MSFLRNTKNADGNGVLIKIDTTQREKDNLRKVYIVSVNVPPFLEPLLFYKPLHFYAKILKPPPSPQRKFQKLELPFIKDSGDGGGGWQPWCTYYSSSSSSYISS